MMQRTHAFAALTCAAISIVIIVIIIMDTRPRGTFQPLAARYILIPPSPRHVQKCLRNNTVTCSASTSDFHKESRDGINNLEVILKNRNPCLAQHHDLMQDVTSRIGLDESFMNYQRRGASYYYTAYYDDRAARYIRILAIAPGPRNRSIFCQIFFKGTFHPYITRAEIRKLTVVPDENVNHIEWMYSCPLELSGLDVEPVPTFVSVVKSPCESPTVFIPIPPVSSSNATRHDFGVCVAACHGDGPTPVNLVEWFELHKILGVSEFNLYNCSMTRNHEVLRHYVNEGTLRLVQLQPPYYDPSSYRQGCHPVVQISFNDCLMRNLHRYKYIVVVDMDEFILPKRVNNLNELVQEINHDYNLTDASQYSFYPDFHLMEFQADKSKPNYLQTMAYRSYHHVRNNYKSIQTTKYCVHMFNHFCKFRLPGSPNGVFPSASYAALAHYRKCPLHLQEECQNVTQMEKREDTNVLKYEKLLDGKVKKNLKLLGIKI